MDGQVVSREVKAVLWPLLKGAGFDTFSARTAWRHRKDSIDVFNVQSFTRDIADGLGVHTFSFAVNLGWFPLYVPPTYPPPVKSGKLLPAEAGCDFRGQLRRMIEQAGKHPKTVWSLDDQGENLPWCIGDVERQGPQILRCFDQYDDKDELLRRLLTGNDFEGLGLTANNPSPRRSYVTGYIALHLGQETLAREKLQEAVNSQCYVHLFTGVEGAIYRAR